MTAQTQQSPRGETPIIVHRDEGEARWLFDSLLVLRATGAATDGRLAIFESTDPPNGRYGPFVSHHHTMAHYVLEGSDRFEVDGADVEVSPGDLVVVPHGVPSSHANGEAGCRQLLIAAPAGLEDAFLPLTRPAERRELPPDAGEPVDRERLLAIWGAHGIEPLQRP